MTSDLDYTILLDFNFFRLTVLQQDFLQRNFCIILYCRRTITTALHWICKYLDDGIEVNNKLAFIFIFRTIEKNKTDLSCVGVCTRCIQESSCHTRNSNFTMHSPTIVNQTNQTIVVFLERGIFYNQQVLEPGQAVSMTRLETGGILLPYYIHAVVGDERNLPDRKQSARNLVSVAAIPTAFVMGALATAISCGTLAGPSAALAPLVSGLVVNGVVIDSVAIAAGAVTASRVAALSNMLVQKHAENFIQKSDRLPPGKRFVVVKGGIDQGPLKIETIKERAFLALGIQTFKRPTETVLDKIQYYLPLGKTDKKDNGLPLKTSGENEDPKYTDKKDNGLPLITSGENEDPKCIDTP